MALLLTTFEELLREHQPELEPGRRRAEAREYHSRAADETWTLWSRLQKDNPEPQWDDRPWSETLIARGQHLAMLMKQAEEMVLDQLAEEIRGPLRTSPEDPTTESPLTTL
jgi:hypothetical protein